MAKPSDKTDWSTGSGGSASVAGIEVRPATPADAAPISRLIDSLAEYFLADLERPQDATAFFATTAPEAVAGRLADPRYRYHVALAAGRLVGCAATRDGTHLYQLFVERAHQGAGLGRRLWEVAYRAAGSPVPATVNASLYAVPFYRRLGFVVTGSVETKDGIAYQPMCLDKNRGADD